jgi:hypothetical protein
MEQPQPQGPQQLQKTPMDHKDSLVPYGIPSKGIPSNPVEFINPFWTPWDHSSLAIKHSRAPLLNPETLIVPDM